ncbi:MAG: DUF308 domain-containing protein [Candidatus Saccharibacteria bacterium]|nr:DUF308 domain-containing protein [Candidatus Saccharibacteria bacterium]
MAKPKAEVIKRPVEQVGGNLKKVAWSSIIESLALIILGILFIVWPSTTIKILAYFIGVFFIVKGGFQVIMYYYEKGQYDFFNNGLLFGVISILLGVAALVIGEDIAAIFRVVIGVIIIYESLVRINTAIKLSSIGVKSWIYVVILALIMMALGIIIICNKGAVVEMIGGFMIATGIIGIVGDFMFIQHVNTVVDKIADIEKVATASKKDNK